MVLAGLPCGPGGEPLQNGTLPSCSNFAKMLGNLDPLNVEALNDNEQSTKAKKPKERFWNDVLEGSLRKENLRPSSAK